MKRKLVNCILVGIFLLLSCAQITFCKTQKAQNPTPEELESIQTTYYTKIPSLKVMKAVLNVLQDDSYFIEASDSQLGFIGATREFDIKDKNINIKQEFGCSKKFFGIKKLFPFAPSYAKTEANINVTGNDEKTTVRVNFRKKVFNLYDATINTKEVVDKNYYTDFYSKLNSELQVK